MMPHIQFSDDGMFWGNEEWLHMCRVLSSTTQGTGTQLKASRILFLLREHLLLSERIPTPSALVSSERKCSGDDVHSVKKLLFLQRWVKVCFTAGFHWGWLEFGLSKVLKVFLQVTSQLFSMENWEPRDAPGIVWCSNSCCRSTLIWRLSRTCHYRSAHSRWRQTKTLELLCNWNSSYLFNCPPWQEFFC